MSHIRGSWLSLFAMLMIFIGPLISQAMPMDHHASMPMPMSMEMGMDMPAHADHEHPPATIMPSGKSAATAPCFSVARRCPAPRT
jgi:Protein of unknown function (DUF2946).